MLQELEPLDGRQGRAPSSAAQKLRVADSCARFALRLDPRKLDLAAQAFGSEIPSAIGAMRAEGERRAICLGPDEWLLHAPLDEAADIVARFAALYADCPHSLVDISHREVGIVIEGNDAGFAINAACPRDLDDIPPGSATRTVFDSATVTLIRESETAYRIEVWRSFAPHVWDLLAAAGAEAAQGI